MMVIKPFICRQDRTITRRVYKKSFRSENEACVIFVISAVINRQCLETETISPTILQCMCALHSKLQTLQTSMLPRPSVVLPRSHLTTINESGDLHQDMYKTQLCDTSHTTITIGHVPFLQAYLIYNVGKIGLEFVCLLETLKVTKVRLDNGEILECLE